MPCNKPTHSWVKTEWLKKTPSFDDQNQIDCFSVMFLLSNNALHSNRNQVKIASPITWGLSDLTFQCIASTARACVRQQIC